MCWKCNQHHKKIFWLGQYREMKWQVEQIVKQGASPNWRIQTEIEEYKAGLLSKDELKEKILGIVMDLTTPREKDEAQLTLFTN
jgi:hypothetical protein